MGFSDRRCFSNTYSCEDYVGRGKHAKLLCDLFLDTLHNHGFLVLTGYIFRVIFVYWLVAYILMLVLLFHR